MPNDRSNKQVDSNQLYGVTTIATLAEWGALTPQHGNKTRSAYLLGTRWVTHKLAFPSAIGNALNASGFDLNELVPKLAIAEHITLLDTLYYPSRTDVMVYCTLGRTQRVVIAVEGKATEPFDCPIVRWIRKAPEQEPHPERLPIKPGRKARLRFLNAVLGLDIGENSPVYYQLVHRTASAVLEANHIKACHAIMLVHAFYECGENWDAFVAFGKAMGFTRLERGRLTEPKPLLSASKLDLRLGWVDDII